MKKPGWRATRAKPSASQQETPYATNFVGYSYGCGFGAFGGIDEAIVIVDDPQDVLDRHEKTLE